MNRTAGAAGTARRAAVVLPTGALLFLLALASPAVALSQTTGSGLSLAQILLVFVGIPLAISGLLAGLVLAGRARKGPRYRPGRKWDHDPVWFSGPEDPDAALAAARPGRSGGGGASAEW